MAFSDRAWCPAGPTPIPDHGGLGEKGKKIINFLGKIIMSLPNFLDDISCSYESDMVSTINKANQI